MILNNEGSRSFGVKVNIANRKPIVSFLSNLFWVQRRISYRFLSYLTLKLFFLSSNGNK